MFMTRRNNFWNLMEEYIYNLSYYFHLFIISANFNPYIKGK